MIHSPKTNYSQKTLFKPPRISTSVKTSLWNHYDLTPSEATVHHYSSLLPTIYTHISWGGTKANTMSEIWQLRAPRDLPLSGVWETGQGRERIVKKQSSGGYLSKQHGYPAAPPSQVRATERLQRVGLDKKNELRQHSGWYLKENRSKCHKCHGTMSQNLQQSFLRSFLKWFYSFPSVSSVKCFVGRVQRHRGLEQLEYLYCTVNFWLWILFYFLTNWLDLAMVLWNMEKTYHGWSWPITVAEAWHYIFGGPSSTIESHNGPLVVNTVDEQHDIKMRSVRSWRCSDGCLARSDQVWNVIISISFF